MSGVTRRTWLGALCTGLAAGAVGCGGGAAAPPLPPPPVPTSVPDLGALFPLAGLDWIVRARPRAVAQIPWLIPAIARFSPEPRLDAFRQSTGLDLRQLDEVIVAQYGGALAHASAWCARHAADPADVERRFTERLTSEVLRAEDLADVVRVSGKAGRAPRAFARIGRDVAVFQRGGDARTGPARIAALRATGKLGKLRAALDGEPLGALAARFGDAPVVALWPGPLPEDLASFGGGVLAPATALGIAARTTAREHLGLALAATGDFGERADEAAERLREAYTALATDALGRILGLDRPIERALAAGDAGVITLAVELEPNRFAEGLASLVDRDLEAVLAP